MNPFYIVKPCIKIAKSEVLFEIYRMAIYQDKYDVEVQNDDKIKHNRMFFAFVQQTFNRQDGFYLHGNFILIDKIKGNQSRKQSAAEVERLNRYKMDRNEKTEGTSKPSPKRLFCK